MTCNTDVVPCDIVMSDETLTTSMLIDSGALDGDYISKDIANKLRAAGVQPRGAKKRVCSAFNDMCELSEGKFSLQINYVNEHTDKTETMHTTASCINTPWPIIIGRPTIKRNNLTSKLPSQFMTATTKAQYHITNGDTGPRFVPDHNDSPLGSSTCDNIRR
jgi:hypothetical protein